MSALLMVNLDHYYELTLSEHVNQQFYYLKQLVSALAFDQDRGYDDLP
jgi:hypothetical protein